jgi:hypothetical protein
MQQGADGQIEEGAVRPTRVAQGAKVFFNRRGSLLGTRKAVYTHRPRGKV